LNFLKYPYDKKKYFNYGTLVLSGVGTVGGYSWYQCKFALGCLGTVNSTCLTGHLQGSPLCSVCCNEALWPELCNDHQFYGQSPLASPLGPGSGGLWYLTTTGACVRCIQTGKIVFDFLLIAMSGAVIAIVIFTMWFMKIDVTSDLSDETGASKDDLRAASRATKIKMLMSYMEVFGGNSNMVSSDTLFYIYFMHEFDFHAFERCCPSLICRMFRGRRNSWL
jgi:hypothetical protein